MLGVRRKEIERERGGERDTKGYKVYLALVEIKGLCILSNLAAHTHAHTHAPARTHT